MSSILEFDSIEKSFDGQPLLTSIYMKCEVGRVTGLLGRNGSGKSTLLKIVFGSMHSMCKSIRIDQSSLVGNYLGQKIIGYLPQKNWLPNHLTIKQALIHFEITPSNLIAVFPSFSDWMDFTIQKLSGGYKRIFEVYLVLYSKHKFVLLDEPFSGLMPKHIDDIKRLINQVKSTKGVLISDHLYRHILEIASDTYLLSNGKTYLVKDKEELVFRGYLAE